MDRFVCPRCGNDDQRYIGHKGGVPYCRRCLSFRGREADKDFRVRPDIELRLDYPLSEAQKRISDGVVESLNAGKNVLIHAVTGAGKTELVYQAMEIYLQKGLHVGFCTPRKDVVIDLKPRIQEAFPSARVVAVYGEHTAKLEGDIITLTTHQLYRYEDYFDLLILDEIDAFPYRGDQMLEHFFQRAVRGRYVLLSATPPIDVLKRMEREGTVLRLFSRYHRGKLIVPTIHECIVPLMKIVTLRTAGRFISSQKPLFIFVPTIDRGRELFSFLNFFLKDGAYVYSESPERKIDIQRFKNEELRYLVTTSILERGVTVRDLQVIVFEADDDIFDKDTLVQISGRVGRKIGATGGEVVFIASSVSEAMRDAIDEIRFYNERREDM